MIKLFIIGEVEKNRGEIFPLLKPFLKNKGFTDEERIKLYGISEKDFSLVNTIEEADYLVLPMSWNYYASKYKMAEIMQEIQQDIFQNKKILSFTSGDFGVKTPTFKNLLIFRCNGEKSKLDSNNLGLPVFINDPILRYFSTDKITVRPYNTKPTVAFCGQANGDFIHVCKEITQTIVRNLRFRVGLRDGLPQPLLSTSSLRYALLHKLLKDNAIISNFIFRKKYRAGVSNQKEREKTTREFYDNIQTSDYVLCVRGGGNFSVRLYESLAMGRIPIFLNTDCLLPLDASVNWKNYVVWIEYSERNNIAKKVKDFHSNLTSKEFIELQHRNRSLWKEKLDLQGFFNNIFYEI